MRKRTWKIAALSVACGVLFQFSFCASSGILKSIAFGFGEQVGNSISDGLGLGDVISGLGG